MADKDKPEDKKESETGTRNWDDPIEQK